MRIKYYSPAHLPPYLILLHLHHVLDFYLNAQTINVISGI